MIAIVIVAMNDDFQDDMNMEDLQRTHHLRTSDMSDIQWQKPILVIGKAGAGKTEAICQSVLKHVQKGLR